MRSSLFLLAVLGLSACSGSAAPRSSSAPAAAGEHTGRTPQDAVQLCHDQGGPNRTDYGYIARYRCPDGSMPLGLDPALGAAARLRNVGPGPDGHVLDLYEVPCPGAPVRIYVDAYHCGDRNVEADPRSFTRAQLAGIAGRARESETLPFDQRAIDFRREVLAWVPESPQVRIPMCVPVRDAVVHREYEHARLLFEQLVASMTAASIEAAEERDAVIDVELEGVLGALRLHDAIIAARGAAAADPALAELIRARADGSLRQRIRELSDQCREAAPEPEMGMIITSDDGRSVWPPSGPGCERLVRCCEERGFVRNGVAVGTQGLSCMLAATPANADCSVGLTILTEQGIDCGAAP